MIFSGLYLMEIGLYILIIRVKSDFMNTIVEKYISELTKLCISQRLEL